MTHSVQILTWTLLVKHSGNWDRHSWSKNPKKKTKEKNVSQGTRQCWVATRTGRLVGVTWDWITHSWCRFAKRTCCLRTTKGATKGFHWELHGVYWQKLDLHVSIESVFVCMKTIPIKRNSLGTGSHTAEMPICKKNIFSANNTVIVQHKMFSLQLLDTASFETGTLFTHSWWWFTKILSLFAWEQYLSKDIQYQLQKP